MSKLLAKYRVYNSILIMKISFGSIDSIGNIDYMTFRPVQFQLMQIQSLPFKQLIISTYCIRNLPQLRPVPILTNCFKFGWVINLVQKFVMKMNQTAFNIGNYS